MALLFVVLGAGVPLRGHAHHDGNGVHLGAPGHDHGVTLVQHDMRVERPTPPAPPSLPATLASLEEVAPALPLVPTREELGPESRAPPSLVRSRAPPA